MQLNWKVKHLFWKGKVWNSGTDILVEKQENEQNSIWFYIL